MVSLGTPVSSINKADRHDVTEILLKVALNTIIPNPLNIEYVYKHLFTTDLFIKQCCFN